MHRALLLLGGFSVVSPTVRGYLLETFGSLSAQVNKHSTIAFVAVGVLCFGSFLWIQLSSDRH
jgi:hypothetical protein